MPRVRITAPIFYRGKNWTPGEELDVNKFDYGAFVVANVAVGISEQGRIEEAIQSARENAMIKRGRPTRRT